VGAYVCERERERGGEMAGGNEGRGEQERGCVYVCMREREMNE